MKRTTVVASLGVAGVFAILTACGDVAETTVANSPTDQPQVTLRRDALPFTYYLAKDVPQEAQAEIKSAFTAWEQQIGETIFRFGGVLNVDQTQIDNSYHVLKNVIFATNRSGKIDPPYGDGYDAIARTIIHSNESLRDTDVVLFGYEKNYVTGRDDSGDVYSVRTVMLHEIGRMLFGDRDGTDTASVLNNPVYPMGHPDEKTALSDGDIALFHQTYDGL